MPQPAHPACRTPDPSAVRHVTARWQNHRTSVGHAQLSLVEHALCPLDPAASLRDHLVHQTAYTARDRQGHILTANVRVTCPSGLSAADEFTLWGLLALTFAQPEPGRELHATPHYCLRKLGLIERNDSKGGKDYQLFRDTVRRLARVIYENTAFYDPIRGEHRDVAFGFLKYSLPTSPESSRAWRFVWDQQFFEFCQATGGSLWFDLATYRKLDSASRRLFVLIQKIFHRSGVSPTFNVQRLCVDVLGFAPRSTSWTISGTRPPARERRRTGGASCGAKSCAASAMPTARTCNPSGPPAAAPPKSRHSALTWRARHAMPS
jgi:hypothetical protein